MEEALSGGNTHDAIVRIGDTVRRPTGPWTTGVQKAGADEALDGVVKAADRGDDVGQRGVRPEQVVVPGMHHATA